MDTTNDIGSWSSDQEPFMLDYSPILSEQHGLLFFEAAYEVAFLPLASQTTRLSVFIDKNKALLERARSEGRKRDYADFARNAAALLLLRDLLQIGWRMTLSGTNVHLFKPDLDKNIVTAKQQVRDSMKLERRESIEAKPVRDFIRYMERPRLYDNKIRNILSLVADGTKLHSQLKAAAGRRREERPPYLRRIVRPYLQIADSETHDVFTGYRLYDIWRYFRLTWSTPNRSVPGRNLFYLVRDAGQPCHPVIGIAALANCVIGLRCRDDRIGWTPEALGERLTVAKEESQAEFERVAWEISGLLEKHLQQGLDEISPEGITTRNTLAYPTQEAIEAIQAFAVIAAGERYEHLQNETLAYDENDELELIPSDDTSPSLDESRLSVDRPDRESSKALFRRKRAAKLAKLLQAKLLLVQYGLFDNAPSSLPRLLWNNQDWTLPWEKGRSALRTVLNANKETKVGTSMMEIIVCGAVAPYNYLLGGKLISMLLTSPEVVKDYEDRYGTRTSTIASQVAGYEVTRPANLVYLGTSSLYVGASDRAKYDPDKSGKLSPSSASQYNRIQIPAKILGGQGTVRYECIGMTEGFGVVHFSAETRQALEELDVILHGAKRVNSIFGEGTSPRLRKIRQGISILGLDDRFLIHGQSRLVYAIKLASNTERYLLGLDTDPHYLLMAKKPKEATKKISVYWIERWLASRVEYEPALESVCNFKPQDAAMSRELSNQSQQESLKIGI